MIDIGKDLQKAYEEGYKQGRYDEKVETEPERKTGRWIKDYLVSTSGGGYGVYRCSVCEATFQDIGYSFNYCPNCGARMDGEQE